MSALRRLQLDPNFFLIVLLAVFAWAPPTYPDFFETHSSIALEYKRGLATNLLGFAGALGINGWSLFFRSSESEPMGRR